MVYEKREMDEEIWCMRNEEIWFMRNKKWMRESGV